MTCTPTAHTACASAFRSACRHSAQAQALAQARLEKAPQASGTATPHRFGLRGMLAAGVVALTLLLAQVATFDSGAGHEPAAAVALSDASGG